VIAGAFAGVAGALFGLFNRGVFPDFAYWSKSAEVLIMVILGGMAHFWGPAIGAAALILLNVQISAYTQYWPFVLGTTLIVLLFVFPGGIVGTLAAGWKRLRGGQARGSESGSATGTPATAASSASSVTAAFPTDAGGREPGSLRPLPGGTPR
jgi:branched-chain amino acid transport system permease protein